MKMIFIFMAGCVVAMTSTTAVGRPSRPDDAPQVVPALSTRSAASSSTGADLASVSVATAVETSEAVTTTEGDLPTLAPVNVVASRVAGDSRRAARATDTIGRAEIERSGARDVAELLSTHAGLDIQRSFRGASLRMSGLEPEHVLILVDGVPVIGRVDGVVDLARINLSDVERIEIVRGASSALHGADALAGVVEITTRRPKRGLEVEVDAVGRSMPGLDGRARATWAGEDVRAKLRAGVLHSDAYDLDPSDLATTGAGYTGFEAGGEGELDLTRDLRLTTRASYLRRSADAIDAEPGLPVYDRQNVLETMEVGAGARSFVAAGSRLDVDLAWSFYRDQSLLDQRGDDTLDSYNDTQQHQVVARAVWTERFSTAHKLAVGVEGTFEALSSERLVGGSGDRVRGSVFAEHGWTIVDAEPQILVVPGVRLDVDSSFGTYATPQLAVRVDPVPEVILRASFGLGFRAPSFQEQLLFFENPGAGYDVSGNPDLSPESSRSWTVRAEYLPIEALSFAVGGYWNDVDDLIDYALIGAPMPGQLLHYRNVNVESARTRGLTGEVNGQVSLGEDWVLGAKLGYELLDARDLTLDQPLDGRSTHQVAGEARVEVVPLGLRVSTRGTWLSERTFDLGALTAPAFALLAARAAVDVYDDHFTFELGIENVLDAGDADLAPIPPRTLYAGITGRI